IIYNKIDIGLVQIVMTRERIEESIINNSSMTIFIILVTGIAIMVTNLLLLRRYLFKPMSLLEHATKLIAQGQFDTKIDISSNDEIGKLSQSFNNMATKLQLTTTDITNLKKVESSLESERDKLKAIFESMDDGAYIASMDHDIQYVNPVLEKEFGPVEGKKCHEYFHDSDEPCIFCKNDEVFRGKTVHWEWTSPRNGKTYDLIDTPLINPDGSKSKLEMFRDITTRKKDQEQIQASLKEKEILLSEIHHRVKNNMQVIISMLRLQSDKTCKKEYVDLLKDSERRVLSMSLVHEQLYQSKNFSNIDFKEYLNILLTDLFISHGVDINTVELIIDCTDIILDLDNAIPCGLIVNELVSNCLKHAFPDNRKGKINIRVSSLNEDEFELTVSDDGAGISKDLDIRDLESMGLQLVRVLAEDTFEGKIELDGTDGTRLKLKLKKVKYRQRI
ncbi:histidine kinase dimerization/phosphoacceptor domain -containing protein, partial [Desulfobacterales bacterium HSG17]|nr:histidine kinase dimerization/phosphoacceptor domain -containing protein [Desulfobacterales bacterium HSG17]